MGGKSSPPPPPDYAAAAKATADGNLQAAQQATAANRVNQYTPYGSLTWSQSTGADGTPQWSQNVNLSDTGQKLLDASNNSSLTLAGLQQGAANNVAAQQGRGWNDSAVPAAGTAMVPAGMRQQDPFSYNALDMNNVQYGSVLDPSGVKMGSPLDPSNNQNVDVFNRFQDQTNPMGQVYRPGQATNTATADILSRVSPQLQQRRSDLENQLANQGITQGSEAWNRAQTQLGQTENDALTQASLQGINLGMQQQGQTYGQTTQNRTLGNAEQQQQYNQETGFRGMQDAEQAQNFGQTNANAALGLQAQQQAFGQNNANTALMLQAQGQQFGQNQAGNAQQFGQNATNNQQLMALYNQYFNQQNAAHQQGLQDQNYYANRDLNQLNAIRSGSQVQNPTFTNFYNQGQTQGPDMLSAANMGYNAQLAQTNAQNAGSAGLWNGLTNLGGAYFLSDARLKTDISRPLGYTGSGIPIRAFRYRGDDDEPMQVGVMAQEVERVKPHAVRDEPFGFKSVNYSEAMQ